MPTAARPARREQLLAAGQPAVVRMFAALLTLGPMTRAELGRRTSFTLGAVTKAVQPLLRDGLVHELAPERAPGGRGRPALLLRVDAEHAYVIGVKITADEVIGVLTDLRAQVIDTMRVPLPAIVTAGRHAHTVDPDTATAATVDLVARIVDAHPDRRDRISGLGVAVSGDVLTRDGLVRFSPLLGWQGIPLARRLSSQTGLSTVVDNDVRALTVAELWFGAGREHRSFALVTAGTGVGCGAVVGGDLVTGANGVAGELGHLVADPRGPRCHCGGTGCVEALIGEAALLDRVAAVCADPIRSLSDAVAAADGTHGAAVRAIFDEVGRVLGLAVASVANLFGPECIVLTGETLAAHDLFAGPLRASYRAQCFGAAARCRVEVQPLRFEQWARGAAALAVAHLVQTSSPGRSGLRIAR